MCVCVTHSKNKKCVQNFNMCYEKDNLNSADQGNEQINFMQQFQVHLQINNTLEEIFNFSFSYHVML
jgi:hypothetical protein